MPQSLGTLVVGEFGCVAIHANLCTCVWGPEVNSGCCSSGAIFLVVFSSQDLFYLFYVYVCGSECTYVCDLSICTCMGLSVCMYVGLSCVCVWLQVYVCACVCTLRKPQRSTIRYLEDREGIEFPGMCYRWFVSPLIIDIRN